MANAEIVARILGDTTDLEAKLQQSEAKVRTFGRKVADGFNGIGARLAGVFSAATVGFAAKEALNYASNMTDAAAATRTGIEEYQVLSFAAREAGASQAQLDKALLASTLSGEKAASGNKALTDSFGRLGINIKDFNALPTELKLEAIGRAYVGAGESQQAFADVSEILGEKAAPKLLQVLTQLGTDGFGALRTAAEEAGNVMDKALAQKLDAAEERLGRFKTALIIAAGEALGGLAILGRLASGGSEASVKDEFFGTGERAKERQNAVTQLFDEGKIRNGKQSAKEDEAAIEQRITDILTARQKAQEEAGKTAEQQAAAYDKQAKAIEMSAASAEVAAIITKGQAAAQLKQLTVAEQIAQLEKDREAAMLRADNITGEGTAKDMVAAAKEVAAIEIQIATIKQKEREDQEKADEKRKKLTEKQKDEQLENAQIREEIEEARRLRPTIGQLASGEVRGSSEAATLSRRFQRLENQERAARARGETDFADQLSKERIGLGDRLQKFGVDKREIDPGLQFKEALTESENKLEAIREEIAKL
jgi:hypothetical protein